MVGIIKYVGWSAGDSDYVCDGTDDHVQINQALAWAETNPGNTVYLRGPRDYDIALSLEIASDTVFTGDSTACLLIHAGITWAAQVPVIKQANATINNIEIHGFEIDCNRWNLVGDEGDGLYNGINLSGSSTTFATNIQIHHMYIHDSLGDGIRLKFVSGAQIHHNTINVMGHEGVYFIEVLQSNIYNNSVIQKDNSAFRTDNSQDIKIYNNLSNRYTETGANGNGAIQIGNQPADYGRTRLTQNIEIYNNTINGGAGSGILLMDAYGEAGTTPQTVHIHHNILTGCGWMKNVKYNGGISVWNWGNGLLIEKNTVTGSYNANVVIQAAIASGCSMTVKNNNITNALVTLATDAARKLPVSGYGVLNMVPARMSVNAENNYVTGNITGSYYQVTPVSDASTYISDALPNGNATDDEIIDPDTGIDIPALRRIQQVDDADYYVTGRTGYIDGKVFSWNEKKVDVSKAYGQDKSPNAVGWGLTDFGLEGAELTLDCKALNMQEMFDAIAAFTKPGRIKIELGGDFAGWTASGLGVDYSTELRLKTIIPRKYHTYSFLLLMDEPYYASDIEKIRSCYIPASTRVSADNCFKGNVVGNSSFENWTIDQSMTWETASNPADIEYRRVRWSKELRQFCAVAASGTDNRIMISDGTTWRLPYGFATANKNNAFRGLCWCPDWGIWVATSISGLAGYHCVISSDGDAWTAKATPALADGNAWGYNLFIPPDETLTTGRVISFAYSGSNARVMYSDDLCESWTQVASADETYNWISADYSPEQKRIVCVAYDGPSTARVQVSDTYGATWEAQTCPGQKFTSVKWISALSLWVACSEDGGPQQIMTSPTGLTGSWTLRDTPICGSTVVPGTGTDVATTEYTTPAGYNYSTLLTDWHDAAAPNFVIPALTNTHIWRIDRVFADLRTVNSGNTAHMKITLQAASLNSGVEYTIAEWSEVSTGFRSKSQNLSIESATNEVVTIRTYLKTSNPNSKAVATSIGYEITEFNGAGGSTIAYTYNQWRELEEAPELGIVVCVAQTGTGNRVMYSKNLTDWMLGNSAADNAWVSLCYSAFLNMWAAVGTSGTGNRIMTSDTYGSLLGPDYWTMADGAVRSSEVAVDGLYSLQITGDGTTIERGVTAQKIALESGKRYIIAGFAKAAGLTAGSARLDIMVGGVVVKETVWDVDGEFSQKQISFKTDVATDDIYVRALGYNLNSGAVINFDKVLIQKASDFEIAATGNAIATTGSEDTIPDVIVEGVTSNPDTATPGETTTARSPEGYNYTAASLSYVKQFKVVLPSRTDGGAYKLDKVFGELRTITAGYTAYLKVTVQAASLNSGSEYAVAEFSTKVATYGPKSRDVAVSFAANESVTISFYVKSSSTSVKAAATLMGYTVTTMGTGSVVTTAGMYMWNIEDPATVLLLPAAIPPRYISEINADGTGSLSYAENFLDDTFLDIATSKTGVTYNATNKSMVIAISGSIVFPFDCRYPVTGIPFIVAFAKTGNPQFSIAEDVSGSPGTFYAIDDNLTSTAENSEMSRTLDNEDNLRLNAKTKYYVKIAPYTGESCEISSLFTYAPTATIDAERFKIFKGGQANTIAVNVTGRSSVVATLRYKNKVPAV